jgi:hypothetical protein
VVIFGFDVRQFRNVVFRLAIPTSVITLIRETLKRKTERSRKVSPNAPQASAFFDSARKGPCSINEEGFERQFAHDEELKFNATARRNKLLGLWAAEKLHADSYALPIVMSEFEDSGEHDAARKIRRDFEAKGVAVSDHQIGRTMDELMAKAIADIKARHRS